MSPTLLTFAPMINSECAHFLLAHYGVAYRDAPHIFGWVSLLGVVHGGTLEIPQLYGDGVMCIGPSGIVDRYDAACPADLRLRPADTMEAMQVQADWERYNGTLARAAAAIAYFHLLPQRDVMIGPFCRGIPATEAAVTKLAYPAIAGLLSLLLGLSAARAQDALAQTRILFEEAGRRLAGRRYLVGDRLSLADIALATAAAPLLLPPNYAAPIPPLASLPPALQAIVAELRAHRTAAYVERIFRDHRRPAIGV